jgi:hypothetical protein
MSDAVMTQARQSETAEDKQGWAWLTNSSKPHYFIDRLSICGKWMAPGVNEFNDDPSFDNSPDNCAACVKKVAKMRSKEVKALAPEAGVKRSIPEREK